ncbi:MAG: hypothetical protein J0H54_13410, partial [Rhizobiales bacterium]|nr:hypothetical protein [Hyphomicrobiales bacterium]
MHLPRRPRTCTDTALIVALFLVVQAFFSGLSIGARAETDGRITAHYTYKRNDGKEVMVRVRDDGSSGVLEWWDAVNLEWYTLLPGLTTGAIMG